MSEFSIGCTTCQARLTVRDASAIGQILACPKCGSMVYVRAPEEGAVSPPFPSQASVATPSSSTTAAPRSSVPQTPFDEDFDLSAAPDAAASGAVASGAVAPPVPAPSAIRPVKTPAQGRSPDTPPTMPPPATAPTANLVESPALLPPAAPSAAATTVRGLAWIAGGVVGGLVLALGIFFLIAWLGSSGDSSQVADANSEAVAPSPGSEEGSAAPVAPAKPDSPAPEWPVGPPTEKPAPVAPAKPDSPAPEWPVGPPTEKPAAQPPVVKNRSKDAEPEGPPELTPRSASDAPLSPQPVGGRFAGLLSDGAPEPATAPTLEPRANPIGKNNGGSPSVPGEEEIIRPRMREIDVPGRLADPIGKLQIKDMPLADFAELVSDMSTIPVTLDADALRMRWISATAPVTVKAEQTTVRGVLSAGIEPLQLGLLVLNGQVRITDGSAAEALQRRRSHDVADLVGADPQQLEILGQWVLELIQPESWTEAGGVGTLKAEKGALVIHNRDAVHFQVLYLCDKLRAARKLSPRGKYAPSLLAPGSLPTRAQAPLQTTIKLNFNRATRLTQILARIGKAANVRILVDWEAVQEAGWTRDAMAKFTVDGKPLSESLALLLGPRDLTYRVIDDGTLEVTTAAAVERHVEWELYPAGDLLAADQDPRPLIERLQDAVGSNNFRAFGGNGSIRFDAVSRSLLVALPEPQQRVAARWLAEQR